MTLRGVRHAVHPTAAMVTSRIFSGGTIEHRFTARIRLSPSPQPSPLRGRGSAWYETPRVKERDGELSPSQATDEERLEVSLRPRRFEEYVGQTSVVEKLKIYVKA